MVECLIGGQVGFGAYTDADETFCAGMTKTIFNWIEHLKSFFNSLINDPNHYFFRVQKVRVRAVISSGGVLTIQRLDVVSNSPIKYSASSQSLLCWIILRVWNIQYTSYAEYVELYER